MGMALPKIEFGKTGVEVTRLGLGGEGILRTYGEDKAAVELIYAALDFGITYFESARAYSGSESYYGKALGERRREIFLATKSHARTAAGAKTHLQESLASLKTDWIDLWFVHDLRTEADLSALFGPGGAMETFVRARKQGTVRFIGLTGHEDPDILDRAMDAADFDAVLLPVNPAEPAYLSFLATTVPKALKKAMGVVGMKVLGKGLLPRLSPTGNPGLFLRYALGTDGVSTIAVGCDSVAQLRRNVEALDGATPLSSRERIELEQALAPVARRILYYKP
jgi:aryl-alcohol dehydrogenase-like predicted oxidoreductase